MQDLEPFYNWRHLYRAEDDEQSPFHGREYSEIYFTNSLYNYALHPQWDPIGSSTLYIKILYVDYDEGYCIIEMMGEWNDTLHNDVMFLKREVVDVLVDSGINKYILIGENVLNFHRDMDEYYEEWFQDVEDGWIALVNFRDHVLAEMTLGRLDYYLNYGGDMDEMLWRNAEPSGLYVKVNRIMNRRLN